MFAVDDISENVAIGCPQLYADLKSGLGSALSFRSLLVIIAVSFYQGAVIVLLPMAYDSHVYGATVVTEWFIALIAVELLDNYLVISWQNTT